MTDNDIRGFFQENLLERYDFSKLPEVVTQSVAEGAGAGYHDQVGEEWKVAQAHFLEWTKDAAVFNRRTIREGKAIYERFFRERGMLSGDVLDIGGGWGLFREWWRGEDGHFFIIHDPGTERFVRGPHKLHYEYYREGLARPATFVEGVGGDLPYWDAGFDAVLIAGALDHCEDPGEVLRGAARCLRPGGTLLVFQQGEAPSGTEGLRIRLVHTLHRWWRVMRDPRVLLRYLRRNVTGQDPHFHHFSTDEIARLIEGSGFPPAKISLIDNSQMVYAFESRKA